MTSLRKILVGFSLFGIGIGLIIVLTIKIDGKEITSAFSRFSFDGLLVVLAFTIIGSFVATWRLKVLAHSQGFDIPFFKMYALWLTGNSFNYTTPFVYLGGEGVKAYLLKERYYVPWRSATSVMMLDRLLEVTTGLLVIVGGIFAFVMHSGASGFTKTILGVGVPVGIIGIMASLFYFQAFRNRKILAPLVKNKSLKKRRVVQFFLRAEQDIIGFFHKRGRLMWNSIGLSVAKQITFLFRHIAILYFLGRGFHLVASVVSMGVLYLGFTVPIPAALGAQEAFQSATFSSFGFGAGEGLVLSFVLRGADIIIVSAGVIILIRYGLKMITAGALAMLQYNNGNNGNGDKSLNAHSSSDNVDK